ncbi:MAG: hypothetical protein MUC60_00575 [Oscillatoria sp. Prado101]|nr:hypothetical protein [Oscillatoria sp. Prado101]
MLKASSSPTKASSKRQENRSHVAPTQFHTQFRNPIQKQRIAAAAPSYILAKIYNLLRSLDAESLLHFMKVETRWNQSRSILGRLARSRV